MRSPNSSALSPLTSDLFRSRLRRIAEWGPLHHMLVKVIKFFRNVQVSCSLLELCRRHVLMLQVKVLQVVHLQQIVHNVLENLTV